jgi:iron complex outermembrane receptor protein
MRKTIFPSLTALCFLLPLPSLATTEPLEALSLEELMAVEVTSVGKRPQKLADAAAAVYVITQQDLRQSGATSVPEALRMVPGLQVARINAHQWAISSRGFNGRFANKLLVLIDGRSVYSPLFSGVFWDSQDLVLEDIERIEVIRGPGATAWGANAVNGVINIITRHTSKTQGTLAGALVGTDEGQMQLRHGGTIGTSGTFRIYGKGKKVAEGVDKEGEDSEDGWTQGRTGFRTDWFNAGRDEMTLQGELYRSRYDDLNRVNSLLTYPGTVLEEHDSAAEGGNLLFRWQNGEGAHLQAYYDRADREELLVEHKQDILDLEWQKRFSLGENHSLTGGAGYRWTQDRTATPRPDVLTIADPEDSQNLFNLFVQDDIQLIPDTLMLTLGTKLEHNSYTRFELQPNARLAWTPASAHTLWAAVSRAVRTPSRLEDSITVVFDVSETAVGPFTIPVEIKVGPGDDYESEELLAYEVGYRYVPKETFSVDLTAFVNRYDNLRTVEFAAQSTTGSPIPTSALVELDFDNRAEGKSLGFELAMNWQPFSWWRLQASYSYLNMLLELENGSTDQGSLTATHEVYPHHQGSLRSHFSLAPGLSLDLWLRAVGDVENLDTDGYITMDANLGWDINDRLELSLVGQNLFGGGHKEFEAEFVGGRGYEVRPSGYVQLRWEW